MVYQLHMVYLILLVVMLNLIHVQLVLLPQQHMYQIHQYIIFVEEESDLNVHNRSNNKIYWLVIEYYIK